MFFGKRALMLGDFWNAKILLSELGEVSCRIVGLDIFGVVCLVIRA